MGVQHITDSRDGEGACTKHRCGLVQPWNVNAFPGNTEPCYNGFLFFQLKMLNELDFINYLN